MDYSEAGVRESWVATFIDDLRDTKEAVHDAEWNLTQVRASMAYIEELEKRIKELEQGVVPVGVVETIRDAWQEKCDDTDGQWYNDCESIMEFIDDLDEAITNAKEAQKGLVK